MNATIPGWWNGLGKALWAAAIALVAASFWLAMQAPIEVQMGPVQKIVYVHVPSAIATLLAFGVTFAASIAYLATKDWRWDGVAASSCEVGLVFATVVMITGPLWARSAWNTWWTWEPRLTTFLILWILYAGYHVVRSSLRSESRRTISSIMGIVFFINLPIVWKSIEWWRGSLHPKNVTMTPEMRMTLLVGMGAWMLFYGAALLQRMRIEWRAEGLASADDHAPAGGVRRVGA
ncbi:MAG TPA: cytochrome c biogenesis protein [Candidatus Eisenbacteria bacterium]|nr:cytochrome c biogenesis protein [Candidatus Eisenbacteria bacterium]